MKNRFKKLKMRSKIKHKQIKIKNKPKKWISSKINKMTNKNPLNSQIHQSSQSNKKKNGFLIKKMLSMMSSKNL